jgi:hypothetical protein
VDLSKGQRSLECRGTAIDRDSPTVFFYVAPPPAFMHVETMPGNPGSFRVWADNITSADRGVYFVDVLAYDESGPLSTETSATFVVGIIPEPASLLVLPMASAALLRLRRTPLGA